jgi:hypothetical protein
MHGLEHPNTLQIFEKWMDLDSHISLYRSFWIHSKISSDILAHTSFEKDDRQSS